MFSLAVWVATGLTVGVIARAVMARREQTPAYVIIAMGILFAVLGGIIAAAIWPTWVDTPEARDRDILPGWLASGVSSTLLLWGYLRIRGRLEIPHRV